MRTSLAGLRKKSVVVLPDVYLDALVGLSPWKDARPQMDRIVRRGGGNLPVGPVEIKLGGNAANTGFALARLGARVDLIAETDGFGYRLLEDAASASGLRLGHVRVTKRRSTTIALEFQGANLMLSHAGPLLDFGPERLTKNDWGRIESADAVVVLNWGQNRRGTKLLSGVARRAHRAGAMVLLDTGDPRHRGVDAAAELVEDRRIWSDVDAWSLNENEARAFARDDRADLLKVARKLQARVGCRIDLHTRTWAASVDRNHTVRVAAGRKPAKRLTGAGDAWNAGNIAGHLLRWDDRSRLSLAHRVATAYVAGDDGLPPRPKDLPA